MARILEPTGAADPLAFNTSVDSGLHSLLGFWVATYYPAIFDKAKPVARGFVIA
jgi:hypothetical protein